MANQVSVTTHTNPEKTADYSQSSQGIHVNLEQKVGYIPDSHETLRIMPLGDSITQGKVDNRQAKPDQEGYRLELWEQLTALGVPIDFVGSRSHGTPNLPDQDHEGHPGWGINDIEEGRWDGIKWAGGVNRWINRYNPNVILLMIGTNDANATGEIIANDLSRLIDKIITNNRFTGDLLVSTIAPIHPDSPYYSKRMPNVIDYNALIPTIVNHKPASENVRFVDMTTGLNPLLETDMASTEFGNGLHPTFKGYKKMAHYWFHPLLEATGKKDELNHQNHVKGSACNDVIIGNSSNNRIEGIGGNDTLKGQAGADIFVYSNPNQGTDTLADFNPNQGDVFEISASGFGSGLIAGIALSTTASNTGVFVSDISSNYLGSMPHFFYNPLTGVLSFDPDGNQSKAPIPLTILTTKPILEVNQFSII